ncbi:MAG TPA: carboxypeptidase regulatory-like domain-containing protein [Candidatus Eisenbacteria bacterium]|nr:carboxypeptidase regulatory-like domain-containing protein [Candidatus Eisenbacteria bacterium]
MHARPSRHQRLALLVGLAAACAITATASAGTINGQVRYTGAPVQRKRIPVSIDQYLCGTEKTADDLLLSPKNGVQNAVVSVQGLPGAKWKRDLSPVKMDQKKCDFVPRIVLVPAGGTVEFLNSDRLLHNVRSDAKENPAFNRAQPHGRTITITFRSPEILRVDCDLHSWMRGWVVVTEHPFYAITDADGNFALENVPPGKYTLQVWHETLGKATQDVTVTDATPATVTVNMQRK